MLAFTDVQYETDHATAACVLARAWSDSSPAHRLVERVSPIAPYVPGEFYKRELPCVLAVLKRAQAVAPLEGVVIDGYVVLDRAGTPGLGAKLYEAPGRTVPVIGVAKTAYRGSEMALALPRPGSLKPLYVTSIGVEPTEALAKLGQLHGPHRLPTLIKAVDSLARGR